MIRQTAGHERGGRISETPGKSSVRSAKVVVSQAEPQLTHVVLLQFREPESLAVATGVQKPYASVAPLHVGGVYLPAYGRPPEYFLHSLLVPENYLAAYLDYSIVLVLIYYLHVQQIVGGNESSAPLSAKAFPFAVSDSAVGQGRAAML